MVLCDLLSSKDLNIQNQIPRKTINIPYSFNNIPDTYDNIDVEHSINSFEQSMCIQSLKYLLTDEKEAWLYDVDDQRDEGIENLEPFDS